MLNCRFWFPEKFIGDGGRSSVFFDSVAIHDEFSTVLESSRVLLCATPCRFVSLKKIRDIVNLFGLWCDDFSVSFIYLNLMCLGWRDYIPCIASVQPDLDLTTSELISFSLDKVTIVGRSMISMYDDCAFWRFVSCSISKSWCHYLGYDWCLHHYLCSSPSSTFTKMTC
jgi:hypothetical protein